ncbi:MAG: membrane protein insertion efficiency factor YidD [Rhodomicrobium sp.]|jgi:putative membrane protein insertion efficiency factor
MNSAGAGFGRFLKGAAKTPVYVYRTAISPLLGPRCRHLPTCSQYALDAIDLNGAWIGCWLSLGRIARCHPFGTHGYDPAPDLTRAGIPFWAVWRYLAAYRAQPHPSTRSG